MATDNGITIIQQIRESLTLNLPHEEYKHTNDKNMKCILKHIGSVCSGMPDEVFCFFQWFKNIRILHECMVLIDNPFPRGDAFL